jgi:glucosamine--fructose-6-phosphate aminotransferase (isomerizing)
LTECVALALQEVSGMFAICVMDSSSPDVIVGASRDSTLIIGESENGLFLTSDADAISIHKQRIARLQGDEIVTITISTGYNIQSLNSFSLSSNSSSRISIIRELVEFRLKNEYNCKGQFGNFMLKEISEQPERLRDALIVKINNVQGNITLFAFLQYDKKLKKASRFIICGCGTSFFPDYLADFLLKTLGVFQ